MVSIRTTAKGLMLTGAALLTLASGARAADCLGQVDRLAQRYNLNVATAAPSAGAAPDATTGGVIQPAPRQSPGVIEPPRSLKPRMPTAPNLSPGAAAGTDDSPGRLSAAERSVIESLLVAARAEAERGHEQDCFDRLAEAKAQVTRSMM